MNFLEKLLTLLDSKMTRPESYGWFHLLSLAVTVAISVFLCLRCRDWSANRIRKLTGLYGRLCQKKEM